MNIKEVIIIEENRIELALYVIELKKAKMIKNKNSKLLYSDFKEKMDILTKEKQEIYNQNEDVINKVLTEYLEEVKES